MILAIAFIGCSSGEELLSVELADLQGKKFSFATEVLEAIGCEDAVGASHPLMENSTESQVVTHVEGFAKDQGVPYDQLKVEQAGDVWLIAVSSDVVIGGVNGFITLCTDAYEIFAPPPPGDL